MGQVNLDWNEVDKVTRKLSKVCVGHELGSMCAALIRTKCKAGLRA
jgi:hypothetical protein